ncbi:MAG: DHHA1 domain-containing protein [Nanoarchaeota archaeon]|nr:DHHA1 domain-containing protein [Nanoarchaeota archaeon]
MSFLDTISEHASAFKPKSVKIVAHDGADGISSAALLSLTFQALRIPYACSFVTQPDPELLDQLAKEPHGTLLFADTGAGASASIFRALANKEVLIIDHHPGEAHPRMLNPLHYGEGPESISSAGISYLFCRALWPGIRSHAHLSIVGALGDRQELESELHHLLLAECVSAGSISTKKGVQLLGYQTRALKYVLAESCGEKAGAVLKDAELDVSLRLHELNDEQLSKLAGALERHLQIKTPFQEQYLLAGEQDALSKEARDFALLLHACGRSGNPVAGVGACVGDSDLKRKAGESYITFRKELTKAKEWVQSHPEALHEKDGLRIVNAGFAVSPQIVGALAEALLKEKGETALLLSRMEHKTKVSLRSKQFDCLAVLKPLLESVGGEAHGHSGAAGGCFPSVSEDAFLQLSKDALTRMQMEELLE